MARGYRFGGGGIEQSNFPWDLYSVGTWDRKSGSVALGSSVYCTCATMSPKIESGCAIKCTITSNRADYDAFAFLQISTNYTNWTTVAQTNRFNTGTTQNVSYNLSSYVGSNIYVRVQLYSGGGASSYETVTACIIEKS